VTRDRGEALSRYQTVAWEVFNKHWWWY